MTYQADAITLRAMEPEDLDFLYKIENDESIWSISATNVPYSRYVLRNYIATAQNDIYADGQVRLIIEKAYQTPIGVIDLIAFDPKNRRAELGIILQKEHQHRGYGLKAICRIRQYAHSVLHLRQLYAYVDETNKTSLKCLQAAGFESTAILKDWLSEGTKFRNAILMQLFL
ncbi:MAG: GNAT family N-acetyltransferase [Prevotellaceae bacterium]|nr:GNAT family N-acetyltransferase [Prevotellaceae bacterium]